MKKLDLTNTLFLITTPISALSLLIYSLWAYGFQLKFFVLFFILYVLTGISITAGYHRLFSHRAYKAHPIIEFLFAIFGAATFENSILKWSADHRIHHQFCDTEKDPYNIKKGFWWAHIGWIFFTDDSNELDKQYPKDLLKNPIVMWQHRNYLLIAVIMGFGVPIALGYFLGSAFQGLVWGGLLRLVFVHHSTFFINSLCHVIGRKPYDLMTTARDSFLAALFTFGEGYHNFHHTFQTDYRNGIYWWQFDPSKWLIKCLESLSLARDLKTMDVKAIIDAKMKVKRLSHEL